MREGIYAYPYLKHIIELWPGYWEEQLGEINEVFREQNCHQKKIGKTRVVRKFYENEFSKCIGCIISEVTYRGRIQALGGKSHI